MNAPPLTMHCAAILFDLDGVLIDSTSCVARHWRAWADKHGLNTDSILRIAHGVRNVDTMRLIAPHLDVEEEATLFADHEVADTEGVVAMQGASSLLASLDGAHWAIVTSCNTALARARLGTAQLLFPPLLITGDDVTHGKPDPEPYLLAARRLGVAPANCVVVEDAPAGTAAGKRAGMRTIGVAFTYTREELLAGGAEVVIDRLTGIHIHQADGGHILIAVHRQ